MSLCEQQELDLDSDGLIDRQELLAVFGSEGALVFLRNLDANQDGNVSHEEWFKFLGSLVGLEVECGTPPVETFLTWAQAQAQHYRDQLQIQDAAANGKQRRVADAKASLEGKLDRRVDRARLEAQGRGTRLRAC